MSWVYNLQIPVPFFFGDEPLVHFLSSLLAVPTCSTRWPPICVCCLSCLKGKRQPVRKSSSLRWWWVQCWLFIYSPWEVLIWNNSEISLLFQIISIKHDIAWSYLFKFSNFCKSNIVFIFFSQDFLSIIYHFCYWLPVIIKGTRHVLGYLKQNQLNNIKWPFSATP